MSVVTDDTLPATPRAVRDEAFDVGEVILKIMPEPKGEGIRLLFDASVDLADAQELDIQDFRGVGLQVRLQRSEIDIDEFVLLHPVAEIDLVAGEETERQRAGDAQLLVEPATGGCDRALAGTRMPATGIRP
jgi:hypothetical protein